MMASHKLRKDFNLKDIFTKPPNKKQEMQKELSTDRGGRHDPSLGQLPQGPVRPSHVPLWKIYLVGAWPSRLTWQTQASRALCRARHIQQYRRGPGSGTARWAIKSEPLQPTTCWGRKRTSRRNRGGDTPHLDRPGLRD
ncbi:hypothetical protein NDU88_006331 [Pleurodeles waltl]|uniref:Uncharacterized protein n=1 Tax=Pleurodeles waltl TaxID=8319 RepID=A0AAV7VLM3_PLEWA|nr:hypothetical protein NDU88_006331 [Pleurodeles waltl]